VFEQLIDHAALFPPASMALDEALAEDREARASEASFVIGRFVVPAARVADLPDDRPPLSVVLADAADADGLRDAEGVAAVEAPLDGPSPAPADLLATHRSLQALGAEVYFELVLDDGWRDSVPALVGAISALGARVKLRCGGAYTPSVEQVALVIAACRDAGVPFKCTAGLHHAVRRGDEHGFLNILAATGAPGPRLEEVLAEEDPEALDLDAADRSLFKSFGSCSWREPVDDLEALGLLA
jgi:hypothetical protein